jgi:hypothetical protein
MHHQHGDGLADDGDPAQPHQRVDADMAAGFQACLRSSGMDRM